MGFTAASTAWDCSSTKQWSGSSTPQESLRRHGGQGSIDSLGLQLYRAEVRQLHAPRVSAQVCAQDWGEWPRMEVGVRRC